MHQLIGRLSARAPWDDIFGPGLFGGTWSCFTRGAPIRGAGHTNDVSPVFINEPGHFCFLVRPYKTNITFSRGKAEVGEAINITCESEGLPEPSFTITHNNTEIIADRTYNISQVKWSDGGLYQCIATNKLGSNSKGYCLTVFGKINFD